MWQGIHGHDAIVSRFQRTLRANRLASTYLFVGPEGVGKHAFALKLAQILLCTVHEPADMDPCGQCESCRLALAGNHPDLDVVGLKAGKKHLLLEQFVGERDVRNQEGLCHSIAMRPVLGRRRVALINDADWFTPESANCLLKTLEEPPPAAVIILVGTSRSRQLPTILSRAQVVQFNPLPTDVVSELALAEGLVADGAAALALAARAEGSLARARELADVSLWDKRDRFVAQWNAGDFDAARLVGELDEFINAAGKEADVRRRRFRQLLGQIAEFFVSTLRHEQETGAAGATLAALDRCLDAEEQLDRNANQSTLLESWIDDLAALQNAGLAGHTSAGK